MNAWPKNGACNWPLDRFLQQQPQVEHWAVLVITPHNRLKLGPTKALQVFLEQQVVWLSLEELSQQPNLDPLLNLLTLPVRPESELAASSQQILASRPDLKTVVLPMLVQRFPQLTEDQIMVIAGIPREEIRHTRAVQDWLAEGRQEGEARGEAKVKGDPPPTQPPLRPLERRHHRPDPGPTAGAAGSPSRCPARLPGPGRPGHLASRQRLKRASACPSIRTEGGEVVRILRNGVLPVRPAIRRAGVNVLLDTNVLSEPMRERPAFADGQIATGFEGPAHGGADIL